MLLTRTCSTLTGVLADEEGSASINERPSPSLHERKRAFVRLELRRVALELFVERGYENTTIDDIARNAGISRRSFFRYFPTKEAVVIETIRESGQFLIDLVARRSADEAPMTTMRTAVREYVSYYQRHEENALRILRLIQGTPGLHARFLLECCHWRYTITDILADRMQDRKQAAIVSATGLALLSVVNDRWLAEEPPDLGLIVDEAFADLTHMASVERDTHS